MNHENLIPISEIYDRTDRLNFSIPFPSWMEMERIGVNLNQTEQLMNIGGINHVQITGTNGKKTESHLVSLGMAPDGSSYVGSVGAVENVPLSDFKSEKNKGSSIYRNSEWVSVNINLNLEEMQQQITNKSGNLRHAESWVPLLDNAVRTSIRKAGIEHLLHNFTNIQKFFILLSDVNNGLLGAANLSIMDYIAHYVPRVPNVEQLLNSFCANFLSGILFGTFLYGREKSSGNGYRISFFPGYEIDRALVLQILARTTPLIGTIENTKKFKTNYRTIRRL